MNFKTFRAFISNATTKLALTYVAIIMLMSIGFSLVFYRTSSHELGRQIPPASSFMQQQQDFYNNSRPAINDFFQTRISEARHELLIKLIWLNCFALVGGSVISYLLARRTLEPIEAAMRAQSQFVSDASHELRTPLTAIQTTNEVALRQKNLTLSNAKDLLKENIAEVKKLQELSNGLLRLASIDATGASNLSSVTVLDAASEAMNQIVSLAQAKDIAVEDLTTTARVKADRQGLIQVLVILLDNAIKYSPPKTTIRVSSKLDGKSVLISVADEGIGIRASDLPHIFRRFYRADVSRTKQTTKPDGYGLGLPIASTLVEQMDGTISVTSAPTKGSTFTIKLPSDS